MITQGGKELMTRWEYFIHTCGFGVYEEYIDSIRKGDQ